MTLVGNLKRFRNALRVKLQLVFKWKITEMDGIWIETENSFSSVEYESIRVLAADFNFTLAGWQFKDEKFGIKLKW